MAWATPSRERRVLKAGHSSIAVTLPKPWAEAMNLRPGDLIVFDQNDDGALYLKPAPAPGAAIAGAPFLVSAHAFDTPGVLERLVMGAYRVGHDAIEIRSEIPLAPERVEELLQAARGLLGVSVVAQEPNRVVLQNFIDPSKYGLPQLVQRMRMILVAFIEESEEMLRRRGRSRRLTSLGEESRKVLALLVRQQFLASRDWSLARRIGSPDPRQLLEWRVVVQSLESLAGLLSEVSATLGRNLGELQEVAPELLDLLGGIKVGLKEIVDAIMHPSLGRACDAYAESTRLQELAQQTGLRLKGPVRRNGILGAALALHRAAGCLSELGEVAIDRAVSTGSETILLASA